MSIIAISFIVCLLFFVFIGLLSSLKSKKTTADYLLAGSNLPSWMVALSAVATANSGYMFIGMIGYTYVVGVSSMWLLIGWILGDFIASLFIHKHLVQEEGNPANLSYAGKLSNWTPKMPEQKTLRFISGIIIIVLLGVYAAAQLQAGAKGLNVLFGWDYSTGIVIGTIIVLIYCAAGGIRASIWTDVAQLFVMVIAMFLMAYISIDSLGGFSNFLQAIKTVSPTYANFFPSNIDTLLSQFSFLLGWLFAGLGVVGQPHIMVRFMAMRKQKNLWNVRLYYYGWYTAFSALTVLMGLSSRILLGDIANFDPELALPVLSNQLLPELLVGIVLAGLFAATTSTADSQILSCAASVTHDLKISSKKHSYLMSKLSTVVIGILATCIALYGNASVFTLAVFAWSALGAAFTPLLVVRAMGQHVSETTAICMLFTGIATVCLWRYFGLSAHIYAIAPGIVAGMLIYCASVLLKKGLSYGNATKVAPTVPDNVK